MPGLSSGTLNLRFMRRAQPEEHLDDARWELARSPAYRAEKPCPSRDSVTYETSYLPFLFPSLHDAPSPSDSLRPRGRRVFGHEITPQPATAPAPPTPERRPHSISTGPARNKPAKNIIFDTSGVGSDLRQSSFLRPSAVDPAKTSDPTKSAHRRATSSPNTKPKRSRAAAEADKPKKKTKLTLIE